MIAVALLVALAVLIVLVAPSVDLPATVLQRLVYALVFVLLLRLPLVMKRRWFSHSAPVACANGPPEILRFCLVTRLYSLRC